MSELHADQGTEAIANALRQASDRLEGIANSNQDIKARFEAQDWSGLDQINTAASSIDATRDKLISLADQIGIGGQIVREARQRAQMVGTRESVTG